MVPKSLSPSAAALLLKDTASISRHVGEAATATMALAFTGSRHGAGAWVETDVTSSDFGFVDSL